jgi:predicted Zn finger-like uncharacterized protein
MNNACPECGAVYAVSDKDIGRRIACKKCNAALIVTEQGLEDDGPGAVTSKREDAPERERGRGDSGRRRNRDADSGVRPRRSRIPAAGEILKKIKAVADIPTWLFGVGLLISIYSFHTPMIDSANVLSRIGDAQYAEVRHAADVRDLSQGNEGKLTEDHRKSIEIKQKEYAKETPRLNEKINAATAAANQAQWWNIMYRIVGLILLAFGAIGYLVGEQPQTKRILGAVTLGIILMHVVAPGLQFQVQTGSFEKAATPPSQTWPTPAVPKGVPGS